MGLLHLIIAALAASAATAADLPCACVNATQTIDPIGWPMIFFQQPTLGGGQNGVTCSMNCDFVANLPANADSNSTLKVQLLTNKLGDDGSISIDGMNKDITITPSTLPQTFDALSYDTSIQIHFKEGATNMGEFMIVVMPTTGRPDKPIVKVTTPAPVTAPYDPKFLRNPRLVANDIMLAFDLSSKNIDKYKTFAQGLINELAINPKSLVNTDENPEDCDTGSRLSVVGLSSINGFDNLYAPYWTTSAEQAVGNIGSFVQIAGGPYYYGPVETKYAPGFGTSYTSCENRGKIFILLTNSPPFECDMKLTDCGKQGASPPPFTDFLNLGVHQILVHYNMDEDDKKYYKLYNETAGGNSNAWNFFELGGVDRDIENFFNTYLVDSKDEMTCQLKSKTTETEVPVGKDKISVNLPIYYKGKGVDEGVWTTPRHYCNFQQTTIQLKRDPIITGTDKAPVCVKVFYDLETGKDFVSIFSGDPKGIQKEVVRLTGRDVSGTTFDLTDADGSIVFSSDEKNVYDGFHAEITKGPCPST